MGIMEPDELDLLAGVPIEDFAESQQEDELSDNVPPFEDEFIWRSAACNGGGKFSVTEMRTKHLFYTWLMIWNHAAPSYLRIWDNHHYIFSSFYTKEYILLAFKSMYLELKRRTDIGPKMLEVIARIEANYTKTIYELAPDSDVSVKDVKDVPED
jgi:hypothetical protein